MWGLHEGALGALRRSSGMHVLVALCSRLFWSTVFSPRTAKTAPNRIKSPELAKESQLHSAAADGSTIRCCLHVYVSSLPRTCIYCLVPWAVNTSPYERPCLHYKQTVKRTDILKPVCLYGCSPTLYLSVCRSACPSVCMHASMNGCMDDGWTEVCRYL